MLMTSIQQLRGRLDQLLDVCRVLASAGVLRLVVLAAAIGISMSLVLNQLLISIGFEQPETTVLVRYGLSGYFLVAVIVAPLLETLLLQQLPIWFAKRLELPIELQFAAGSVPFALAHFRSGVNAGITAGVVGGLILGTVYLSLIPVGKKKAFYATAGVHLLHNLCAFLLYVIQL